MGPLTVDGARAALEAYVATTTWRRRGAAATLRIEALDACGAHRVVFQSFTEARALVWTHQPYRGGDVDGADRGPAPGTWDIPLAVPPAFRDAQASWPVPHTSSVRACHACGASGRAACGACRGAGSVACPACDGRGAFPQARDVGARDDAGARGDVVTLAGAPSRTEPCACACACTAGRVACARCAGGGVLACDTCDGARELLHFARLDVAWRNVVTEAVLESPDVPARVAGRGYSVVALLEEAFQIAPVVGAGEVGEAPRGDGVRVRVRPDVDAVANKLIAGHALGGDVKLLRQRLVVQAAPVYEARYRWGADLRRFWVCGTDARVHAPGYPLSPARLGAAIALCAVVAAGGLLAATRARRPRPTAGVATAPVVAVRRPTAAPALPVIPP